MPNELDDIILGSRDQDEATIQAILDGDDYAVTGTSVQTDQQPEEPAAEAPAVADPAAPAAPEAPAGDPAAPAPVKISRVAKWRTAAQQFQTEAAALRAEKAELERKLAEAATARPVAPPAAAAPPAEAAAPPAPAAAAKPKLTDFVNALQDGEVYEDAVERFQEALLDYRDKAKTPPPAPAKAEETKPAETAPAPAVNPAWQAQLEIAKAYHPDWDQVMAVDHGKPMTSPVMVAAIQQLEDGAERIWYLAHHPEVSQKIARVTTLPAGATQAQIDAAFRTAYMELGKFELPSDVDDALELAEMDPAPPPAPVTPAPVATAPAPVTPSRPAPRQKMDPPKPLGSRGGVTSKRLEDLTTHEEIDQISNDEWRARTTGVR